MATQQTTQIGYTYKTLAERTGLSARFWRREVALGRIPYVKFDKAIIVLPADLDRYLLERRREKNEGREQMAKAA